MGLVNDTLQDGKFNWEIPGGDSCRDGQKTKEQQVEWWKLDTRTTEAGIVIAGEHSRIVQ